MRYLGVLILCSLVALGVACTPDSLEGFEDDTNANNGNANNGATNNGTVSGGAFTTEFTQVSGILASNCGQPACHGSASSNAFFLATNDGATPNEMMNALVGATGVSGNPMIVGGDLAGSDIWDRMTLDTADPLYMPFGGGTLQAAEYTAIETWITNGAVYQE